MKNLFLNPNRPFIIHLIGIGGIGMSAIAELLLHYGYSVQGSDIIENKNTQRLAKLGIHILIGHSKNNIKNADVIIYSSAIKDDNIEFSSALKQKKIIKHRSDVIAELSKTKRTIAISGSHGKTTTTAMISSIFDHTDLHPTVITGGIVNKYNSNVKIGSGEWLIVEADESDGTMVNILSEIAVVTNVDNEHLDYYKSFSNIENKFCQFLNNVSSKGLSILPYNLENIVNKLKNYKITYGLNNGDVKAINIQQLNNISTFDLVLSPTIDKNCQLIENIKINAVGRHNILNALAAISVAINLKIPFHIIRLGLEQFSGVQRRFTLIAKTNLARFFDDYAHHPTEIEATLLSARGITLGRVICIIQPHRFTRLRDFFSEFVRVLAKFDYVIITDVYSAGEKEIPGFSSQDLETNLRCQGFHNVATANSSDSITTIINNIAKKDDIFLFMGAGNITNIAYTVANNIKVSQ